MNKLFIVILFSFVFISISNAQEKLGADILLESKTQIKDILNNPENFLGKKVLIEGEILDVCKMAGCWMELSSSENDQKIKVKVKDGDIIFPVEAIGKTAVVEGEVYKIEMDKEKAIAYFEHVAEENGKEFDPASITDGVTLYQIKGSGAVIKNYVNQIEAKD